jgi:hypothetical protein
MYSFNMGLLTDLWATECVDAIPRAILFSDEGNKVTIYELESGNM